MAIDSAEKRKAISGIQPFTLAGMTPSAAKGWKWRQQVGRGYPGVRLIPISIWLSGSAVFFVGSMEAAILSIWPSETGAGAPSYIQESNIGGSWTGETLVNSEWSV